MRNRLLSLASVVALSLTSPAHACVPPAESAVAPAPSEVRMTGELRFYRCIDPVTGRGAVTVVAGGREVPLDLRQLETDILLRPAPHVVKGHWGAGGRLIVTEAHPTGGAGLPPAGGS